MFALSVPPNCKGKMIVELVLADRKSLEHRLPIPELLVVMDLQVSAVYPACTLSYSTVFSDVQVTIFHPCIWMAMCSQVSPAWFLRQYLSSKATNR